MQVLLCQVDVTPCPVESQVLAPAPFLMSAGTVPVDAQQLFEFGFASSMLLAIAAWGVGIIFGFVRRS